MTSQKDITLHTTIFSAIRFYEQCGARIPEGKEPGFSPHPLRIIRQGIERLDETHSQLHLKWVDGLWRQHTEVERFLFDLQRGRIPAPLHRSSSTPGDLGLLFTSLHQLAESRESLLSLLVGTSKLEELTIRSSSMYCPSCTRAFSIFCSPQDFIEYALKRLAHGPRELWLSSSTPQFTERLKLRGFSFEDAGSNRHAAFIDSFAVADNTVARAIPTLLSVWDIPDLVIDLRSSQDVDKLSPHGFCKNCRHTFVARSPKKIRDILRFGSKEQPAEQVELAIDVGGVSLGAALSSPIAQLDSFSSLRDIIPKPLLTTLLKLEMGSYSLSTPSCDIASRHIPCLAALSTIARSAPGDTVLIDVPPGILLPLHEAALSECLNRASDDRGVVILGGSPNINDSRRASESGIRAATSAPLFQLRRSGAGAIEISPGTHYLAASSLPLASQAGSFVLEAGHQLHFGDYQVSSSEALVVSVLKPFDSFVHKKLHVIEALGLFEPLSKLFASSTTAKMAGITPQELSLRGRKSSSYACPSCLGSGVHLDYSLPFDRPRAEPCTVCNGSRFGASVRPIMFSGFSLGHLLNSNFTESVRILRILPRSQLPLQLIETLGLSHLPLGMPLSLLSFSERRRLQIALAVLNSNSSRRNQAVVIELPNAGLTQRDRAAVHALLNSPTAGSKTAFLLLQ